MCYLVSGKKYWKILCKNLCGSPEAAVHRMTPSLLECCITITK